MSPLSIAPLKDCAPRCRRLCRTRPVTSDTSSVHIHLLCRFTETFHTALVVACIYITSVTEFGNLSTINDIHWTGKYSGSLAGLTIGIIQVIYPHILPVSVMFIGDHFAGILCVASALLVTPMAGSASLLVGILHSYSKHGCNQCSIPKYRRALFVLA